MPTDAPAPDVQGATWGMWLTVALQTWTVVAFFKQVVRIDERVLSMAEFVTPEGKKAENQSHIKMLEMQSRYLQSMEAVEEVHVRTLSVVFQAEVAKLRVEMAAKARQKGMGSNDTYRMWLAAEDEVVKKWQDFRYAKGILLDVRGMTVDTVPEEVHLAIKSVKKTWTRPVQQWIIKYLLQPKTIAELERHTKKNLVMWHLTVLVYFMLQLFTCSAAISEYKGEKLADKWGLLGSARWGWATVFLEIYAPSDYRMVQVSKALIAIVVMCCCFYGLLYNSSTASG